MHFLHFGFGLGAVIASQMTRPFLSGYHSDLLGPSNHSDINSSLMSTTHSTLTLLSSSPATAETTPINIPVTAGLNTTLITPSRLDYPYSIAAGFSVLLGLLIFALHIKGPPAGFPLRKPHTKMRVLLSPGSCTGGHTRYGAALLVALFFYHTHIVGGERLFGSFVFSYSVDANVAFTKNQAATLASAFFISHMSGSFLGIFVSHFVPIPVMVAGDILCGLVTIVMGTLFAYDNPIALWTVTVLMGAFIGVLYPAGMAWANLYMEPNSMAVMLFMMGGATGNFTYQYTSGYMFDVYGMRCFFYILIVNFTVILFVFVGMQLIARTRGSRFLRAVDTRDPMDYKDTGYDPVPIKSQEEFSDSDDNIEAIPLRTRLGESQDQ